MKKKLEKDIQREICEWLEESKFFFWKHNAFPRFNFSTKRYMSYPKYTPAGLPDIMLLLNGMFITLEVKVPDYWKYTNEQKLMRDKLTLNGGFYHLVTSLDEVKNIMAYYTSK